jgi:hypothetical protein
LLRIKFWVLLDPFRTLPKFRLEVLAESVPEPEELEEFELDFDAGVPAAVKPTQPASDTTARQERIRASRPSGARLLRLI